MKESTVNRNYKDRLFRLVFQKKKDLLQLYNAVNGTEYTNEEDLVTNTLEDVVYLHMKNDLSFLFGGYQNVYEHQSTFNPNMPLRGFLYIGQLFQGLIDSGELDLYGSKLAMLPAPQYVVFYNGTQEQPDRMELKLSSAFGPLDKKAGVECTAVMLNINLGHNRKLMEKCRVLKEYSIFVAEVRKGTAEGYPLKEAIERAVDRCIEENILKDILTKNRAEVTNVVLTEYDEERHIANEKKLSREEGRREGIREGKREGIRKGKREGMEEGQILKLISIVRKKTHKGQSPLEISEDLLESQELINEIYTILKNNPQINDQEIYKKWRK